MKFDKAHPSGETQKAFKAFAPDTTDQSKLLVATVGVKGKFLFGNGTYSNFSGSTFPIHIIVRNYKPILPENRYVNTPIIPTFHYTCM